MWPPSSTGIGIRFSRPRFRLIIAIRLKSAIQPVSAASPDSSAIATGPISCFTDVSRVNRPPSVCTISLRPLPVLRDAQLERFEHTRVDGAQLELRELRADA